MPVLPLRIRLLLGPVTACLLVSAFTGDLRAAGPSNPPVTAHVQADLRSEYVRPKSIPNPESNAWTAQREALGRMLFFDPRLSGTGWISCASCHNPGFAWEDRLPVAIGNGMKQLKRRTPTIANLAWAQIFFWDGRAGSLEEQATGPITSAGEMGGDMSVVVSRIEGLPEYRELFAKAYPGETITAATVQKAIAAFERTVVTGRAPFDEWVDGNEHAISEAAKRGFVTFNTRAKCALCHSGWRFTDDSFHDIGVKGDQDLGRGAILTELPSIQHAFKTPTLRNVGRRGPYMHNGSEKSIAEVIELYDLGGREKRPSLAHEIRPLNLTAQEKSDLLAFLESLNSKDAPVAIPELP